MLFQQNSQAYLFTFIHKYLIVLIGSMKMNYIKYLTTAPEPFSLFFYKKTYKTIFQ